MTDRDGSGLLDRVASFSSCTRTELDLLSFIANETPVEAGTVIIEEGTLGREAYVIESGRAKVMCGRETLGVLGPGEFFGEMSLLAGAPRFATVTAETPMVLMVLSPAEFDSLLVNAPSVLRKMMRDRRSFDA